MTTDQAPGRGGTGRVWSADWGVIERQLCVNWGLKTVNYLLVSGESIPLVCCPSDSNGFVIRKLSVECLRAMTI